MLADFKTSFTAKLSCKFAARRLAYFPPHLKYVTTLPCEIQKINNSNWCIFEKCWSILKKNFTIGLSSKFAAKRLAYFPPPLKYVTTLPCEIQKNQH